MAKLLQSSKALLEVFPRQQDHTATTPSTVNGQLALQAAPHSAFSSDEFLTALPSHARLLQRGT